MNFEIKINKWRDEDYWRIVLDEKIEIPSLRHLDKFKLYFLQLSQNLTKIKIDTYGETDQVRPEQEPELSYS